MKELSAADANRHFSKLLRKVRDGQTVTITSRGQAVGQFVPMSRVSKAEREAARKLLLDRLKSQPVLNLPRVHRDELYDD